MRSRIALRSRRASGASGASGTSGTDSTTLMGQVVDAVVDGLLALLQPRNLALHFRVVVTHVHSGEDVAVDREVVAKLGSTASGLTHDRDTFDSLSIKERSRRVVDLRVVGVVDDLVVRHTDYSVPRFSRPPDDVRR